MADTLADKTLAHLQIDPNQAEKAKMRRRFTTSARVLEEFTKAHWLQTKGTPVRTGAACVGHSRRIRTVPWSVQPWVPRFSTKEGSMR